METNFWTRVDYLLQYNNLTRKELASYAGFNVSNIGKGIANNNCPSADTAVKVAKFLHTTVEYLVTGQDSRQTASEAKNLDTLYKYSHTIHQLDNIPEIQRDTIKTMIESMGASYNKDDKN